MGPHYLKEDREEGSGNGCRGGNARGRGGLAPPPRPGKKRPDPAGPAVAPGLVVEGALTRLTPRERPPGLGQGPRCLLLV